MRATASYAADFDGVRVAPDDLIGAPGGYYREPAFSGRAIRFAAVQQGGAEGAFDETRRFLARLGRTGDPFQRAPGRDGMARRVGPRLWLDGAARHAAGVAPGGGAGDDAAGIVAYARMMQSAIEDNALRVPTLADRSVGARPAQARAVRTPAPRPDALPAPARARRGARRDQAARPRRRPPGERAVELNAAPSARRGARP